jgi:hypothetical protein
MKHILNAGVLVLLLVLTIEAASINRSLRRIEHEQRRLATPETGGPAWYLMRPPVRHNIWDVTVPFSQWEKIETFLTEKACRPFLTGPVNPVISPSARAAMAQRHMAFATSTYSLAEAQSRRCVAADDSRLKK